MRELILIIIAIFIIGCSDTKNNKICPECNMPIVGKEHTSKAVIDTDTYFFDDVGCMVLWLEKNSASSKLSVYSTDTKKYIDAKKAYYSIKDKTPMNYGFGAYEKKQEGLISFKEMSIRMLRGENLANPKIRKKILGH